MGNGYGSALYDRERDFQVYDQSPASLRALQQHAVAKWSAHSLYRAWYNLRQAGASHHDAILTVANGMHQWECRETRKAYGARHPEAQGRARRKPAHD